MFKIIPLFGFLLLLNCEKPEPQRPKVIFTETYIGKKIDSIKIQIPSLDSIFKQHEINVAKDSTTLQNLID